MRQAFSLPAIEPVKALNVDLSTMSAATDVAIGFGEPLQEIVDLNLQSGPDPNVAARLLLYNAALHWRYLVPVRTVVVLLRPKAWVAGLNGKHSYGRGGKRVTFGYDVIRLWKEPVELFLQSGVGLLPLAPLCKLPGGKPVDRALREIVREIDRRLACLPDHAQAVRLMTATYILTGVRVRAERRSALFEGVTIMHKTAWDEDLEKIAKAKLRVLRNVARQHLGEPDKKTEATLNAIQDPDRLDRMADVILSVKSWKELLAVK
ncbi:MAG: hypothetical protein HYR84_03500 [Planctomycetes bacterium]|nr:hypothetical protein [Planctomycetota bacterium]